MALKTLYKDGNFNSHPRVGGDDTDWFFEKKVLISIRTPAWGVTSAAAAATTPSYFNSHPRVGGDWETTQRSQRTRISIRTPAWGVTC